MVWSIVTSLFLNYSLWNTNTTFVLSAATCRRNRSTVKMKSVLVLGANLRRAVVTTRTTCPKTLPKPLKFLHLLRCGAPAIRQRTIVYVSSSRTPRLVAEVF